MADRLKMQEVIDKIEKIKLSYSRTPSSLLQKAVNFVQQSAEDKSSAVAYLNKGMVMLDHLIDLQPDEKAMIVTLLYPAYSHQKLSTENIEKQFGQSTAKLLSDIIKVKFVESIEEGQTTFSAKNLRSNNLRKMLLAIVDDARVVIIKLVEQLVLMESLRKADGAKQKKAAKIVQKIYAPLANALGIGQLKWQLEDWAFRYSDKENYIKIAKALKMRRVTREAYIELMAKELKSLMKEGGIKSSSISGRAKHILSIYRKISRKNINVDQIYDISAFRILVESVEACYEVLGLIHQKWRPIVKEFDDYIANPKPNGYQSIHTAIVGPESRRAEIQIRTYQMHQESELGVAAHWVYKEGGKAASQYDAKVNYLRQVINWQQEMDEEYPSLSIQEIFNDRVYVFTPHDDVIDLPKGATPLDFAYRIHTQVGHGCRGAKINDLLVPLTYQLKTGDKVAILASKSGKPSRDWLKVKGYLLTPNARAKVQHYFKHEGDEKNLSEGVEIWHKFCKRNHLNKNLLAKSLDAFNFKTKEQLLIALGNHDLHVNAIYAALKQKRLVEEVDEEEIEKKTLKVAEETVPLSSHASRIVIDGVHDLLTQTAGCCKPIPGDEIIGYITKNRGITIHKSDCVNIKYLKKDYEKKLIQVEWDRKIDRQYPVDIIVEAENYQGLLNDITNTIISEKGKISQLTSRVLDLKNRVIMRITISIVDQKMLNNVLQKLKQLPKLVEVKRR